MLWWLYSCINSIFTFNDNGAAERTEDILTSVHTQSLRERQMETFAEHLRGWMSVFDLCVRGLMNNNSQSSDFRVADNSVLVSIHMAASAYLFSFTSACDWRVSPFYFPRCLNTHEILVYPHLSVTLTPLLAGSLFIFSCILWLFICQFHVCLWLLSLVNIYITTGPPTHTTT